jgi:hypothetical protein
VFFQVDLDCHFATLLIGELDSAHGFIVLQLARSSHLVVPDLSGTNSHFNLWRSPMIRNDGPRLTDRAVLVVIDGTWCPVVVSTLSVNSRRILKGALFVAFALLVAIAAHFSRFDAWSLPPHLLDQCGNQRNSNDSAPIVIVGVLSSDTLVRSPVPMRSDPKYPLQLRRLRVQVENVLKGAPISATIAVYYFTWAGGFDGPRPLGLWTVGSRRIFWLRRDAGVLRTVCDGWDGCTMSVNSGAHLRYRPDPRKSLSYALADLRLTRGEGTVNEIGFASEVSRGVPVGTPDQHLEAYVVEKLRLLASTERGDVKSSACELLWIYRADRIDTNIRRDADDAMHAASCRCTTKPDGNLECQ